MLACAIYFHLMNFYPLVPRVVLPIINFLFIIVKWLAQYVARQRSVLFFVTIQSYYLLYGKNRIRGDIAVLAVDADWGPLQWGIFINVSIIIYTFPVTFFTFLVQISLRQFKSFKMRAMIGFLWISFSPNSEYPT